MDFSLTEEQEMLQKTTRDFLATECPKSLVREMAKDEIGHPLEFWQKTREVGWLCLIMPEQYGGIGQALKTWWQLKIKEREILCMA